MRSLKSATLLACAVMLLPATCPLAQHARAQQTEAVTKPVLLETFRNRDRVLVVYRPAAEKAKAEQFRKLWSEAAAASGWRERDGVVVEFSALQEQPDVARRLGLRADQFTLALIGKDGHVAYQTHDPVGPATLFAQVDAMPMRRDEMKMRHGSNAKP